ncbi:MAG: hypothetical protein ACPHO4_10740, partial [Longimicrobiales bacterium]
MRLTVEEHPEAIKRYAHLKPVRGFRARACYAGLPGTSRSCTRKTGHRGPHVAHGRFSRLLAVWDSGGASSAGSSSGRRRTETSRIRAQTGAHRRRLGQRRPMGLTDQDEPSLAGRALRGVMRFLKSPDEVAFV